MSPIVRPRRSVLYMPGSNARALEKAKTLPADAVIVDLEDAVAPDAKETAREQACAATGAGGYGEREVTIRVNGLDTEWGEADLKAAAKSGADAIVLPKVERKEDVAAALALMTAAGAPEGMAIWCMVETPLGVLHVEEVAGASPRIACLVMGTNDLVKATGARLTASRLALISSLNQCILAARAHGLAILDGVYNDIRNEEEFAAQCRQGAELGFDGKTLIHPSQIEPCNRIFSPSDEEIAAAEAVVAAFADAAAAGKGVVTVDGRMVEALHVEQAHQTLALARAIAARAAAGRSSS